MQRKADRDPRALAILCAKLDHALKLAVEAARPARQPNQHKNRNTRLVASFAAAFTTGGGHGSDL